MQRLSIAVVCLTLCAIWIVYPTRAFASTTFTATLSGANEVPSNGSTATGSATVVLNDAETQITVDVNFAGLTGGPAIAGHIHGPASPGNNAAVVFAFTGFPAATSGSFEEVFAITPTQVADLQNGLYYINIHTSDFPGGEIRGWLTVPTVSRISRVKAHRNGSMLLVTWRVSEPAGIAGFNVFARQHRLNRLIVRVHRSRNYRYLVRGARAGPFHVEPVLAG